MDRRWGVFVVGGGLGSYTLAVDHRYYWPARSFLSKSRDEKYFFEFDVRPEVGRARAKVRRARERSHRRADLFRPCLPSTCPALGHDLASRMTTAISSLGLTTYGYSKNQSLTSVFEPAGFTTMAYDKEERLKQHEYGTTVTNYLYYNDNMKAVENIAGVLTTLIWDGTNYLQGRS
jgi:YD repeat-containing protein